jgi:hypothetical protein
MSRLYIFSDEAGDLTFRRAENISRYFIVCTVTMDKCNVANALLRLRRKLVWHDYDLGDYFHASSDRQAVRDLVFETIGAHDIQVQATIMEKSKAEPQVHPTKPRFYHYGWYYHFRHGMQPVARPFSEIHVTAASIGDRRERPSFKRAIRDVLNQTMRRKKWIAGVCPAATDPCLQVADYCAWAIQRKWESDKLRSYDLIKDRITYEFELWEHGNRHYY